MIHGSPQASSNHCPDAWLLNLEGKSFDFCHFVMIVSTVLWMITLFQQANQCLSVLLLLYKQYYQQCFSRNVHPVRLAYQPPASSTFLSEQTSYKQPASSTFLSEQTSTSHQLNEQAVC
jgi:hypothetical protein